MKCEVISPFPSGKYKLGQIVDSDDFPGIRGRQLINIRRLKPVFADSDTCRVLRNFSSYRIGEVVNTTGWRHKKKLIELGRILPIEEPPVEKIPKRKIKARKKTRKRRKTNG